MSIHKVLGKITADPFAEMLDTGFSQFISPSGLSGLAKFDDEMLTILAIDSSRSGSLRRFMGLAKENFEYIRILEVWNPWLSSVLERYGFVKFHGCPDLALVDGYEWRRPTEVIRAA